MRGRLCWSLALVAVLGLLQAGAQATSAAVAANISFGTGNDVGARSDNVRSVALGDLDDDGDLDIVSGDSDAAVTVWQDDGTPFSGLWTQNSAGASSSGVQSVAVGDLDNDGDLDVVSGDSAGVVTAWQNDGSPFSGTWTSNQVGDNLWNADVALGDLDNDGDLDVVCGSDASEDYEVVAWQNDGTPFVGTWAQNDVGASSTIVWSVAVGDLDNDGDLDIVTGSAAEEDYEVIAWQNGYSPGIYLPLILRDYQ